MPAEQYLEEAARAVKTKRRADKVYRAALLAAVAVLEEDGARDAYAQAARAVGVSRQSVRELVTKSRAP